MKQQERAAIYFLPAEEIDSITPYGSGNVNDTFLVTSGAGEQWILQRLNPAVFPQPLQVMHNLRLVTGHLRRRTEALQHIGRLYRILSLVSGRGGDCLQQVDGSVWRLMNMIGGTRTCRTVATEEQAEELGRALGAFHLLLGTLQPSLLYDTLPGFHDTPAYLVTYDRLPSAGKDDPRTGFCRSFIARHRLMANLLANGDHTFTRGVIHGDPKVHNFLFDESARRVVSLIDLDTVKPGLLLHDLGDALRSCCNPAGETPPGRQEAVFDAVLFAGWLRGYLGQAGALLSAADREHIVEAAALLAFELGLRFFSDYLAGNRYFKVRFADHNLQRAETQFQLVRSIERQRNALRATVSQISADTAPEES